MTGWLIYDGSNIDRNRFFIDRWMDAANRREVTLTLVTAQEISWGVREGEHFLMHGLRDARPDFAVMRAPYPLLSAHFERMDIPCFNNAKVADICNDKQKTHSLLSDELPMMPTAFLTPSAFLNPFPYPVVVKGAHGCGGRAVRLARDGREFQEAVQAISPDTLVVQPLCDEPGKDLRVYVLGNQIIAAMLRFQESDFRSNVGLGGGSSPVPVTDELRDYTGRVLRHFDTGLVGIDFIYHQGRLVFNEVEDAVGTRMLYMHTARDIADEYLSMILSRTGI